MLARHIESLTHRFAKWAGSSAGLIVAIITILAWVLAGEFCSFSENWFSGLTVYIGIITFLMIFILQRSQNKELTAIHVKLNELVVSSQRASNSVVNIEELSEKEISDVQEAHRQIVTDEAR